MKIFSLQDKIIWHGSLLGDLSQQFYPSFFKEVSKRESFFKENFSTEFKIATLEDLKNIFIPIYSSEIMGRENYTLDREKIIDDIISRVEKNPERYNFFFIYNNQQKLMGATLFSIIENRLGMAFRAYRRDIDIASLKHKASLDYWGEKLIREYGKMKGLEIFSHGKDSHPYCGRKRIGLSLYKMKTGTRPKMADASKYPVETKEFKEDFFFSQSEPVVFFTNPHEDGFYKNGYLYYPKNSLHESLVNEFQKVAEWANINFETIEF